MKPKDGFDASINRAEHLLKLYELLHDTRQRAVRKGWASKFKRLMRWPDDEEIVRIDGQDTIVLLREGAATSRDEFNHTYLSELLRASLVTAVSALDRFMHDLVVDKSWSLLGRAEGEVPRELTKLRIPVLAARSSLDRLRKDASARPGTIIKKAIQDVLHREFTFQSPDEVQRAASMLGCEDFWGKIAKTMPGKRSKEDVIGELRRHVTRRNQIVHEADMIRKTRGNALVLREIRHADAESTIVWIKDLGAAIEAVVP